MKYGREVISLLAAHPGREFRFKEIQTYVCLTLRIQRANTTKVGVQRVLSTLSEETKSIRVIQGKRRNRYVWIGT